MMSHKHERSIGSRALKRLRLAATSLPFPLLIFFLSVGGAPGAAAAPVKPADCERLKKVARPGTQITIAEVVPKGAFKAADGTMLEVPEFCRVHGIARPTSDSEIHFELWLPASGWNGRFRQYAESGTGGSINYRRLAEYLSGGSAAATTDDGHSSGGRSGWAFGHPQKVIDWGNRAQVETATNGKALIAVYYGKAAKFSYLSGCSGGGRSALKAAQRYPRLWDGILAGAPTMGGAKVMAYRGYHSRLWLSNPLGRISPEKLPAIKRAALAACSPRAGVIGGIASDPRYCRYDPTVLLCQGVENASCLTAAQVATLKAVYAGPRSPRTGVQIYPGVIPTAESTAILGNGQGNQFPRDDADAPLHLTLVRSGFRDFAQLGPGWDAGGFDLDVDLALFERAQIGRERLGSLYAADDPDLSQFRRRGGKLIVYYGWQDGLDNADYAREYYERVVKLTGSMEGTRNFFRLFLVPGMDHCAGGEGANAFGQVGAPSLLDDAKHRIDRALEAWVEEERPPERVIAAKFVDDEPNRGVGFTRPLCAYPQVLKFKGSGSKDLAKNFACSAPYPD